MVIVERYVAMLEDFFIPYLDKNKRDIPYVWFQ